MKLECNYCGQSFLSDWSKRKYCTHLCYSNSRKGVPNLAGRVKPILNTCKWCGKTFATGGRRRPNKRAKYCSLNCLGFSRMRISKINLLSQTNAAYIAGLIDGE